MALDEARHYLIVGEVEVAHRFVEHNEVARLAQSANYRHALLLAYRQALHRRVNLVANAQSGKHIEDFALRAVIGELIFEQHILQSRQFGEKAHLLRQIGNLGAANLAPTLGIERSDVGAVESDLARVVGAIAIDVAAERRFARATLSFNHIVLAFFEDKLGEPYIACRNRRVGKHFGQYVMKFDSLHLVFFVESML